jgi:hypothetical protein
MNRSFLYIDGVVRLAARIAPLVGAVWVLDNCTKCAAAGAPDRETRYGERIGPFGRYASQKSG